MPPHFAEIIFEGRDKQVLLRQVFWRQVYLDADEVPGGPDDVAVRLGYGDGFAIKFDAAFGPPIAI